MKKKQWFSLLSLLLALSLGLTGCMSSEPEEGDPGTSQNPNNGTQPNQDDLHVYKNTVYTYSTAVDESILTTELSPAYLILANKTSALSQQYVPASLSYLDNSFITADDRNSGGLRLEMGAKLALQAMLLEMQADGVEDIQVTSAYRPYEYQQRLFENAMKRETATITAQAYSVLGAEYIQNHYTSRGKTKLDYEDAKRVVLSDLAYPGTSEHQTGLCVDFVTSETGDAVVEAFENTEAFAWLQNNAYKFGFILRYPKDKVETTGYSYEPWHYRFVGREAATDIRLSGFCLEEYLIALQ